jgi:hypothetical protein
MLLLRLSFALFASRLRSRLRRVALHRRVALAHRAVASKPMVAAESLVGDLVRAMN